MRVLLWVVLAGAGCAETAATCPLGTKLTTDQQRGGRAEWCVAEDSAMQSVPVIGKLSTESIALGHPQPMSGGVQGPYTSWYAGGALESHGHYATVGGRSLPDGVWTFWKPDGSLWVVGAYDHGQPSGCFATWDAWGARVTGSVKGDELKAEPCTPPSDDEAAVLDGRVKPVAKPPAAVRADLSVEGMGGPNHLGISNPDQLEANPTATYSFQVDARVRAGRWRIGPEVGVRLVDNDGGTGYLAGATLGYELPKLQRRLESEVALDLAVQHTRFSAQRRCIPGNAVETFWAPVPAAELRVAFEMSPSLAAVAGLRVEGAPAYASARDVKYCVSGCTETVPETWDVGGFSYGLTLGLRLLVR